MTSRRRGSIVEWIVLLVPMGGVLLLGWLVARQSCSVDHPSPGDVAAPGAERGREPQPEGGAS
jgi:hypothetical protein